MSYNPNDFYPQADKEVESDGTLINVENSEGTLLSSATRTASTITPTQKNYKAKGIQLYLSVTAVSGTGGLTLQIFGIDPTSGSIVCLNALPSTITATGLYTFELYPGSSGAVPGNGANWITQRTAGILPKTFYVRVNHGDATNYTYSLGYSLIL